MTNSDINRIDSILTVKASGLDSSVDYDLSLPQGRSIAQLLNDQKIIKITDEKEDPS